MMSEPTTSQPPINPPHPFSDADFIQLEQHLKTAGQTATLDYLEGLFRQRKEFPQLFEVLKMRCRARLNLPIVYGSTPEPLDESTQRQLEDGLLAACTEVGLALWREGDLEKGWLYLQPVGHRPEIVAAFQQITDDDHNRDAIIEIAISQGLAPTHGFDRLLKTYGICDAITTYDVHAHRFDQLALKPIAELLLRHLYRELVGNLKRSLSPAGSTEEYQELCLAELIQRHPHLGAAFGHQVDATHLASVVRIARLVDDPRDLQKALELSDYGSQLHPDFHYPGVPPFEETYRDHQLFYGAQLGIDVETAVTHFRVKCETIDSARFGGIAFESLADLLNRMGRRSEAIEVLIEHTWGRHQNLGIAPNAFLLARNAAERARVKRFFREKNDLLSYSLLLLSEQSTA